MRQAGPVRRVRLHDLPPHVNADVGREDEAEAAGKRRGQDGPVGLAPVPVAMFESVQRARG